MKKQDDKTFAMILEHTGNTASEVAATFVPKDEIRDWEASQEGKLAVDVAQDEKNLYVVSTMAGAYADRIEVFVHNDLLTIRGLRTTPLENIHELDYYYKECYWGVFSRTIVLPVDVKGELAHATYQNGILTVAIPKRQADTKIEVEIVDE